jgi:hypothetical protein
LNRLSMDLEVRGCPQHFLRWRFESSRCGCTGDTGRKFSGGDSDASAPTPIRVTFPECDSDGPSSSPSPRLPRAESRDVHHVTAASESLRRAIRRRQRSRIRVGSEGGRWRAGAHAAFDCHNRAAVPRASRQHRHGQSALGRTVSESVRLHPCAGRAPTKRLLVA